MDHLEVVKLMEQSGGKVWEEGNVSAACTATAAQGHISSSGVYLGCFGQLVARASKGAAVGWVGSLAACFHQQLPCS